jgi:hypothetical protein
MLLEDAPTMAADVAPDSYTKLGFAKLYERKAPRPRPTC